MKRTVVISGDALKNIIKGKKLKLSEASLIIGQNDNYISACCSRNLISEKAITELEKRLKIKPQAYIEAPEPEGEQMTLPLEKMVKADEYTVDTIAKALNEIARALNEIARGLNNGT